MHLGKRPFKILDQIGEAPLYRALPGDQNIIIAFHGAVGRRQSHRFLQASPRPVAQNRSAKGLGRGEAEPGKLVLLGLPVTLARLEHERRRNVPGAAPYMQKLRAGLETSDRRHRWLAGLGRQTLASLGSAPREHLPAARRRHACAKAMALLADEPRWLIGAFQGSASWLDRAAANA